MKHHGCQQETNSLGSAVNCASQATGLAGEVEVEVQSQKMLEDITRHFPDSLLRDAREDCVTEFLE